MEEVMAAVPDALLLAARALRDALTGFEPALVSGRDCAQVVEELARTEKACAAARARAAARAADCGAHTQRGFADPADWLARRSGQSRGEAQSALATAHAVDDCPATKAALLAGADPEQLHDKQRAARRFRHWRDELGLVCFTGALSPEVGLPFINRLEAETDRQYREAKRNGPAQAREAHAADALAALVTGRGKGRVASADLVVVCDLAAYRRGHVHPGETCQLMAGGPIPVGLARRLGQDAFLKAVVHDGVAIHTVAHFGRRIPAELRTALELGSPPDFDGVSCIEAGCDRRYHLEWDHVNPLANGGATCYDNLKPRCWPHHRDKTERDRLAGLLGGAPP
jgi:hypothetical protein